MPLYGDYSDVASALTLLPGRPAIQPRLYLWQPEVVFAARVNWPTATYPLDLFDVDGVTVGAIEDARAGMTILLGSAPGLSDYGRQRIRKDGAGDRLFVGRSSRGTHDGELTVVDNAYVTVWDLRLLWAKIPYIAPPVDGVSEIFKDSDIPVEDHTEFPDPVANTGAGFAATIDAITGLITVLFNGQRSFAVAPGATLVSFLWNIKDGTLTSGSLTDDFIEATFPAGRRYVELTVTDSNGKSHTASCPVYARDPDADTSFAGFDIEGQIRATDQGQTVSIRALEDMPHITYPEGTLAMSWDREPTGTADRQHMLIIGWLDTENAQSSRAKTGVLRDTTITILDGAAKVDTLPGFPQAMADDASRDTELIPSITWNYMVNPNLDWYIIFLLYYHSTALEVLDFVGSGAGDDYPFALLASDGESLWNQVDRRARAFDPDYVLTCDRVGRLAVVPDPMIQVPADRTSVVQAAITEDEYSDIRFSRKHAPVVHWLRGSAILAQPYADLPLVAGVKQIQTVFSIAPGDAPGQGVGEVMRGEKLALSQASFNASVGNHYARANAPFGFLTLTLVQDDSGPGSAVPWRELEPALKQWVTVNLDAEFAAQRGWTFSTARGLPRELSIRYNRTKTGTTRTIELTVEVETVGEPGQTVYKPVVPPVGEDPLITVPPPMGLIGGQELLAGIGIDGYRYKTTDFQTLSGSGGPTWARDNLSIAATIYSWVVDPFSPGYAPGATSGAVNGWVVNDSDIYRVTDLFGTTVATSVLTFAVATSGASFHWRSIQASFGAYFAVGVNPWLLCVSYYGDTVGHTGTWATRSLDGGVTWSAEVQISAHYNTTTPTRFNPIAVFTSPRTPGFALTAAYSETAADAQAVGYVSGEGQWGESWTPYAAIDPGSGNAGSIHLPWPDNIAETILYHGQLLTTVEAGTPEELLPYFGYFLEYQGEADDEEVWVPLGFGVSVSAANIAQGVVGEGVEEEALSVIIAPPPDAVRMVVSVTWSAVKSRTGGSIADAGISFAAANASGTSRTGSISFVSPSMPGSTFGGGTLEWTFGSAGDWPVNNETILSSPPTTMPIGCRLRAFCNASSAGDNTANGTISWTVEVLEIELDNGTIYTPTLGSAGRGFRLKRIVSGVAQDISPDDGSRLYGVNRFGFAARSHDSNRQYVVASVIGNDVTGDADDDFHAIYASSDAGNTWAEVVAPIADSGAPTGRPAFEAAFGGDSEQIIYIWGLPEWIAYSDDLGATVDERSGNLGALGASGFIGIAGGPLP